MSQAVQPPAGTRAPAARFFIRTVRHGDRRRSTNIALRRHVEPPLPYQLPVTHRDPRPRRSRAATGNHSADPITITHERVLTGASAERLVDMYVGDFAEVDRHSILTQAWTREQTLDKLQDPDLTKIVAWKRGVPIGAMMMTNRLDKAHEMSLPYLREHYPDHLATDRIYFCLFMLVSDTHRGTTLLARLITEMNQAVAKRAGVLVYDICDHNRTTFDGDRIISLMAGFFPRSKVSIVDRQYWYVTELPEALPER